MFTEEDSTAVTNEDKRILNNKKMLKCFNFVTFKELKEVLMFLKIADQAFEAGDFLNIFLRFLGFWGFYSSKNKFPIKNVYYRESVNECLEKTAANF